MPNKMFSGEHATVFKRCDNAKTQWDGEK
ncbi:hypothetical protein ACCAA_810037 [Candidatus Accumulibacter aalborgensis]|uniref:Uncharacterized protein n=1 Tax=Candidatus Accumulibacter aalborgensis TaxID=1860102 RepID=A0A1A8XZ61_9PROT|nr:hypothetical protein ACCAA_810037 [Candidatus Accumulibacter aalborgensis]